MATIFWAGFILFVLGMLYLDVRLFHKAAHAVSMKEAIGWTIFWVVLALLFSGFVYLMYEHDWLGMGIGLTGLEAAGQYVTAWLVEKSLSFDNVFVFALVFAFYGIPLQYQHRVLFWGIIGALVLRAVMILAGAALIAHFEFVMFIFALLLLYAAAKMLFFEEGGFDPNRNVLFRLFRRLYPVHHQLEGERFFIIRPDGVKAATPLFLVLLVIESSDVLFAIDSVPACFGITRDPFLVFTSNIFAILGLRSLYFVLAAMMKRFEMLKYSLISILVFIGLKMMSEYLSGKVAFFEGIHISTGMSLLIVLGLLVFGILASLVVKNGTDSEPRRREHDPLDGAE